MIPGHRVLPADFPGTTSHISKGTLHEQGYSGLSSQSHLSLDRPYAMIDHFTKIGTLYAAFFFLQAYGYAHGIDMPPPNSLYDAVTFGMTHLTHIFTPWDGSAWPLGPFTCGILLLFTPHLVIEIESTNQSRTPILRIFGSLIAATSIITLSGVVLGMDRSIKILDYFYTLDYPLVLSLIYAAAFSLLTLAAWKLLRLPVIKQRFKLFHDKPASEIAVLCMAGLLFFLAYIGGKFDGKLDRYTNAPVLIELEGLLASDK